MSRSDRCMAIFFEAFMPSVALFIYNLSCDELLIMNLPIIMFFFVVIYAPQLFYMDVPTGLVFRMDVPTSLVFRITMRQLILSTFVLLRQFVWDATDLQCVPMPYMLSHYLVVLLCAKCNSLIALSIPEAANVLYLSTQYQNNPFILVSYALVSITAIFSPVLQRPRILTASYRQSWAHDYFLMLTTVIFVILLSTENFKNAWVAIYQFSHFAFCADQRYKIHNSTHCRTFILWGESMNMYPTFSWKGITAKFCYSLWSLLLLKNDNPYVFVSDKYHRKKYVDVIEWEIHINNNLLIKTSKFFSKYVHNELSQYQYGTMRGTIDEKYIFTTKIYLLIQEVLRNLGVLDVIKRINLMYLMYVQKMKWQMLRYGQYHVFDMKYLKSIIKQ